MKLEQDWNIEVSVKNHIEVNHFKDQVEQRIKAKRENYI